MNITSVGVDDFEQDIQFSGKHLEDLCKIYNQKTSSHRFENYEGLKAKSNIRIKRKSQSLKNLEKNNFIPQQQTNQIKNAKTVMIPAGPQTSLKRELLFLKDLVNRKKQQTLKPSVSTQLGFYDNEETKTKPIKANQEPKKTINRLEGQKIKNQTKRQIKKIIEYEHYDMVVKDLLSEIKFRKEEKKNSPSKILDNRGKTMLKCHVDTESIMQSKIKLNRKKSSMVFRMNEFICDSVYEKKITSYIMFLYKINFSNSIYVDLNLSNTGKIYKMKIGPGNNGRLIKSLIKRRFWFQFTADEQEISFIWTQNTQSSIHKRQEGYEKKQMKDKSEAYLNKMKKIKSLKKVQEFELNEKILREKDAIDAEVNYLASNNGSFSIYPKITPSIITNHIPHNYYIASKKILFHLLNWYYTEVKNVNPFLIIPKTYHLHCGEVNNPQLKRFFQLQGDKPQKIWIIKPGQNTNQGHGISVASLPEISRLIRRKAVHKNGEQKTYIIQQYIKPFLYYGRKFDMRHYLLITSVNGYIKGYWYKQGYIRTCGQKYDLDDLSNEYVHLTNDAIQKRSDSYGKYEQGNKLSYYNFQRYLDTNFPQKKYSFENQILAKMKQITKDVLHASFTFLDPERKQFNFQLYGMDFIIDSKFKPYLIEINANPCLQTSSPLLQRIIPTLTQHTLRVGLDPLLPPPQHYPPAFRYQLNDRILEKMKYELIFDQKYEGQRIRNIINDEKEFELGKKEKLQADEQIFENEGEELDDIGID